MVIARKPDIAVPKFNRASPVAMPPLTDDPAEALRLTNRFLAIANRHSAMQPLLDDFATEIKTITGCEAVGIRVLDDRGHIPYQSCNGFSPEFYREESDLNLENDTCVCTDVITGNRKAHLTAYYTEHGSFCMGSISRHRAANPPVPGANPGRGACRRFGYETLALLPIRQAGKVIGLIHLVDSQPDRVSPSMASLLENVALQLGTALVRVQIEEELQKYRCRLEDMVLERTTRLQELNTQLIAEAEERQKLTESLRRSEERFRALFNAASDAIFLHFPGPGNRPGKFAEVNEAACNLLGYTADELYRMRPNDIIDKKIAPMTPAMAIGKLKRSGKLLLESAFITREGESLPVEIALHLFDFHGSTAILTIARDIRLRRQTETKLRQQEERVSCLIKAYINAQDEEREWLSFEVHDRVIQPMAAIYQQLQGIVPAAERCPETQYGLSRAIELTDQVIRETRSVMKELYPSTLNRYGLPGIIGEELERFRHETGCQVIFNLDPAYRSQPQLEKTLYRVFHEALLNIRKYAAAPRVTVSLKRQGNLTIMRVADNGIGFDPGRMNDKPGGLASMRRRTELLGGIFEIKSRPGMGTIIVSQLPDSGQIRGEH
ncbi:multi-sensor signal transduction histidine kinase [Dehalogenimonas lykanthroporepellens BL-DC-9]|jgi:PAS domain S-box-containing protein|nr:multi-sensor signal transduction histidine kinase [Dehalogenimonas lykanthroporepellens BL-DC-9]